MTPPNAPQQTPEGPAPPLVEIGLVVVGRLAPAALEALKQARSLVRRTLQETFPAFAWRIPIVRRREKERQGAVEPVRLLDLGTLEREAYRWDFALVVTGADLVAYFKPFAFGTPAKAFNVAVLSLARLPPASGETHSPRQRTERMAHRTAALMLHLFGHLNDLPHSDDPADSMFDLQSAGDLDRMTSYGEPDRAWLQEQFAQEADPRLEETGGYRGRTVRFYLRTARRNAVDIGRTLFRMRPWLFPLHLSRLTTAAVSALLVLLLTAEAWELGMSQPPALVLLLSVVILLGTTAFVVVRQQLLFGRRPHRLSEQRVISNISVSLAVLAGMTTTYVLLFSAILAFSFVFFGQALVASWAASVGPRIGFGHHLVLAGFTASLGLAIGALGASFEARGYIRHVAYVDEET